MHPLCYIMPKLFFESKSNESDMKNISKYGSSLDGEMLIIIPYKIISVLISCQKYQALSNT